MRRTVRHRSWIARGPDAPLESCVMEDVSVGGARITLADPHSVPDRFELLLSADGKLRRRCTVMWRSAKAIGVRFSAT